MFKKRTLYLSVALLSLPLVANASADLRPLLEQLNEQCAPLPASLDDNARQLLLHFYAQREGQPAWQDSAQLLQLHTQIEQLADDGLFPHEYPLPLVAKVEVERHDCADLLTSHSYLQALLHLRRGRASQQRLEPLWRAPELTQPDLQLATLSLALLHLNNPDQAFASARPATPLYQQLRQAYAQRRQQMPGDWAALPGGRLLRPQGNDERLPALRTRLLAEGYLSAPAEDLGTQFDPATLAALQAFQRDHGLNPDGILGPASLNELNLDALTRREQLRANLERLRWLADDMASAEVLINVAAAELLVAQQGQELWRTRTQVGRLERQTPLLASRIERLTLNPTWTVPPTILREDKLPAIRDDPDYLALHQFSVFDRDGQLLDPQTVDWDNPGAIKLRQSAGSHNPLGRVALRFANPFAVYLHDTPSQQLFSKAPRPFSSGCVRVEAVDSLLAWLLPVEQLASVHTRISSGDTQQYRLPRPAPLLIAYWTVEASATGQLRYLPDIYGWDAKLIQALAARSP